jgi:hypothetical protein
MLKERQQELGDDRDFIEKTVDDSTQLKRSEGNILRSQPSTNIKTTIKGRSGYEPGLDALLMRLPRIIRCMRLK